MSKQANNGQTDTQTNDETLLSLIESANSDLAEKFLKKHQNFSQKGLDKALILACQSGFKFLVQALIRLGAKVNATDTHGNTPLMICVECGHLHIVRFLLKKKADVNAVNSLNDTALILAIRTSGSLEMVKVLLEQEGINITHQNMSGHTALMKAMLVKDIDVMKLLMERYSKLQLDGGISCSYKPELSEPLEILISRKIGEEEMADICGLGNIYQLLKKSITSRESSLVLAVESSDVEAVNLFLDCEFVDKNEDVQEAFSKIFQDCDNRNEKSFSQKEVSMIKRLLECGASLNTGWYMASGSPLSVAVKFGDYNVVELLCQYLTQGEKSDIIYATNALSIAVNIDRHDLIELLLKHKININGHLFSDSPLDTALVHGKYEIAEYLIQSGAKVDIGSALHSAVTKQIQGYMDFLFKNYYSEIISFVAERKDRFNDLFAFAVNGGNLGILSHFIEVGADVNCINRNGEIFLIFSKNGDVAKFLISKGANVNLKAVDGSTPLTKILNRYISYDKNMYTSSEMEVVKVLLENGASVNERNRKDKTPIMIAASRVECVDMLQILLNYGADLNDQDGEGNTALMLAVEKNLNDNATFLLQSAKKKSQFLNIQNKEGLTALMTAAIRNNVSILKELINSNADVNIKNVRGNTALLLAAQIGSEPDKGKLTTLVQAGSDVDYQNNDGLSPLMIATERSCDDNISVLLDLGADVNAVSKNNCKKTALSFLQTQKYYRKDIKPSLKVLLSRGADSSYANPLVLLHLIVPCDFEIIREFIRSGHAPTQINVGNSSFQLHSNANIQTVSPLSAALLVRNVSLARYFVDNLFLTSSDVTNLRNDKTFRSVLEQKHRQRCINFLDEIFSQPMSLYQLTFVTVSSAVGASPGRKNRVSMLPLPQIIKDKLNFKSEVVKLNILPEDAHLFDKESNTDDDDDDYNGDIYVNDDSSDEDYGYNYVIDTFGYDDSDS